MNTRVTNPPLDPSRFTPEEGAVRPFVTLPDAKCKDCGGKRFERVPRFGFWQETVMPFFDRYPWRCIGCGKVIYRSNRVARPMRRSA
jgi:hypothetical protein